MIRLIRLAATSCLIAALAGLSACGGDSDEPSGARPADFAFTVVHADGTVAPPFHAEWAVEVRADGSGRATFTPDYAGEGVPTYRTRFEVSDADMDAIYTRMRDAGLLEEIKPADDPPVGGSVDSARIYADGETFDVPPFAESGDAPLAPVIDAVKDLVPEPDWRSFERRRDAYARREYGERP